MRSPEVADMTGKIWRVLVVEDEPGLRQLFAIWARSEYAVTAVESVTHAMEVLTKSRIDVLVTDFNMPQFDGLDLLRWCRSRGLHFPVILMTASRVLFEREELALSDCCAEMLTKPLSRYLLLEALERARQRSHLRDCEERELPSRP